MQSIQMQHHKTCDRCSRPSGLGEPYAEPTRGETGQGYTASRTQRHAAKLPSWAGPTHCHTAQVGLSESAGPGIPQPEARLKQWEGSQGAQSASLPWGPAREDSRVVVESHFPRGGGAQGHIEH